MLLILLLVAAPALGQGPEADLAPPEVEEQVMPDLTGLTLEQAKLRLVAADLRRWQVVEIPSEQTSGVVFHHLPLRGAPTEGKILLYVTVPPQAKAPAPAPRERPRLSLSRLPLGWLLLVLAQPVFLGLASLAVLAFAAQPAPTGTGLRITGVREN